MTTARICPPMIASAWQFQIIHALSDPITTPAPTCRFAVPNRFQPRPNGSDSATIAYWLLTSSAVR